MFLNLSLQRRLRRIKGCTVLLTFPTYLISNVLHSFVHTITCNICHTTYSNIYSGPRLDFTINFFGISECLYFTQRLVSSSSPKQETTVSCLGAVSYKHSPIRETICSHLYTIKSPKLDNFLENYKGNRGKGTNFSMLLEIISNCGKLLNHH